MAPDIYRAVIDEAHARGFRVAVHLFYLADAKDVQRAGADVIAHSAQVTWSRVSSERESLAPLAQDTL